MPWLRPTFPPAEAGSIIGADSFHFLVRDGKGWYRVAPVTRALNIINDRVVYFNSLFLNKIFFGISNSIEPGISSFLHEFRTELKMSLDFPIEKFGNI